MKATVFGAGGFIGSHLVRRLQAEGWDVLALGRGDQRWRDADLGHAFYCVGLTADFRSRPFETIEAHVGFATELLRNARFDSFLYLSSTRVYSGAADGRETSALAVNPTEAGDLYNLSKLLGEAACLAVPRPEVRIARVSNVFGRGMAADNFLMAIVREAVLNGRIDLRQALESEKDYIAVEDVAAAMLRISVAGGDRLYNLASGSNTTHAALTGALTSLTGCTVTVEPGSLAARFPVIATERLQRLGFRPLRKPFQAVSELAAAVAGAAAE